MRGDLSIRRLLASCIRHANPHRPPPCICRWPHDDPACCPSAAVVEGLFNACQALSLQVERCLVP
ncbi:hypothetical protein B9Y82_10850 [Stenotrophomonas maltophilia]|nr:hypothetical protein B9Y82_10850 [Stenotrophomonas maltophilia]